MSTWEVLESEWAARSGPLPEVRTRAEGEARRHRRARVSVTVLLAGASLAAIPAFTAPEPVVHLIGWGIVGFCLAMGIGFAAVQRAAGPADVAGPREALGFLERRLEAERRSASLVRWIYLVVCTLGIVATHLLYEQHGSPLPVRLMTLACFLFGLCLSFSAPWWFRRIARRRETEIQALRRWLEAQQL